MYMGTAIGSDINCSTDIVPIQNWSSSNSIWPSLVKLDLKACFRLGFHGDQKCTECLKHARQGQNAR